MATSYGVGKVTIGQRIVGHVAVTDVVAVPALSPRIRFGLSWTLGHLRPSGEANLPGDEYHLIDFGGELRVGADDQFVGTLVRDGSTHPLRSLDHVQTQEGFVALDLGMTCLKEGSSKTESPSQPNSGRMPPDTFTHLLTQPLSSFISVFLIVI